MGPCIVIIFYYINPNKMHMLQILFYLTTASHGVRHPQHTQSGSNSSTIAADNNKV
jgi:hypothetical protein